MDIAHLLLALIAIFVAAKLFGEIAERFGQPAVLGELIGGVIIGVSGLRLVDPHEEVIHLLSELGVILLLFLIGLETDLKKLMAVGGSAMSVAFVGVAGNYSNERVDRLRHLRATARLRGVDARQFAMSKRPRDVVENWSTAAVVASAAN